MDESPLNNIRPEIMSPSPIEKQLRTQLTKPSYQKRRNQIRSIISNASTASGRGLGVDTNKIGVKSSPRATFLYDRQENQALISPTKYTSTDTNLPDVSQYGSPKGRVDKIQTNKTTHSLLGTFKVNELSRRNINTARPKESKKQNKV